MHSDRARSVSLPYLAAPFCICAALIFTRAALLSGCQPCPFIGRVAALIPALFNVTLTLAIHSHQPQWLGLGASLGLLAGFATLFVAMRAKRRRWLAQG